jgi:transposase
VYRPSEMPVAPQADLAKENERLRLEIRVLREEREILKKAQGSMGSSSQAKDHEVRVR